MIKRSIFVLAAMVAMLGHWAGGSAFAATQVTLQMPQDPKAPINVTVPGFDPFSLYLPAREQLVSTEANLGPGYTYRAHSWCVSEDPILPSFDFSCDMNQPSNPMIQPRVGWPPKVFSLDFVLPKGWFFSAIDPVKYANTGQAVPIAGTVTDQATIFAPAIARSGVAGASPPVAVLTVQSFARCDVQAFYHMRIDGTRLIIDTNQTTNHCKARFPPEIQF